MPGDRGEAETIVCVLGAPRSGTSLTARLLHLNGLYLGEPGDLLPPGSENSAGFWELRRAISLNERILRSVGGSNIAAPALPDGWQHSPRLDGLRQEARALISETFKGKRAWGWKDPRNSFALPLWEAALGRPVRCVVCVRNPLEAAASGRRMAGARHRMGERRAIEAWERYMASAVANTGGRDRLFVDYEGTLADPRASAERLARFAGLEPRSEANGETPEGVVDLRLRHHRSSAEEALRDVRLPASTRSLYSALLWHSRDTSLDGGETVPDLDRIAKRLLAAEPDKLVGPPSLDSHRSQQQV